MNAKIVGISSYLPPKRRTSKEVEELISQNSPDVRIIPGIIEMLTGITVRPVTEETVYPSDLAAEASKKLLNKLHIETNQIDLLIFASAGQDLIEPATANIVQEKLGTRCPVFDVKNACNSFIVGLQVAEAFIKSGQYHKILVTVGETPSKGIKWSIKSKEEFKERFAGYTFGDAGAAALVEPSNDSSGIWYRDFTTVSKYWEVGTLPGGGAMHPRGDEYSYFRGDGAALKDAFLELGPTKVHEAFNATHLTFQDIKTVFCHQVSMPFLELLLKTIGIDRQKVAITLPDHGNMAAASMPVAFDLAEARGDFQKGDKLMFIGMAGGISLGVIIMEY